MTSDDKLWKKLYIKDFTTLNDSETSWRTLYLRAARERKMREKSLRQSRSEPAIPHPYAVPGHYQPPIPGAPIIPGRVSA